MKPDSWMFVSMYLSVVNRLGDCYKQTDLERAWRLRLGARYDIKALRERRADGRGKMIWPLELVAPMTAELLDPMVADVDLWFQWLERLIKLSYNGQHSEDGRQFTCDECYAAVDKYQQLCDAHAYRLLELAIEHDFENVYLR
jgi:hypothetical protein